jgi:hypothetical protein
LKQLNTLYHIYQSKSNAINDNYIRPYILKNEEDTEGETLSKYQTLIVVMTIINDKQQTYYNYYDSFIRNFLTNIFHLISRLIK